MRSLTAVTSAVALFLLAAPVANAGIWTPVDTGTNENIRAVEYQSATRLWFVTDNGKVFRRLPDGSFAQAAMTGGSAGVLFRDVAASSDGNTVVAVGDASGPSTPNVWRSTDGGATFARASLPAVYRSFCDDTSNIGAFGNGYSVQFASAGTVYVTGQHTNILKSTNGGASWFETNKDGLTAACKIDGYVGGGSGSISDSQWVDGDNGYFIARDFGEVNRTSDGLTSNGLEIRDVVNGFDGFPRLAIDPTNQNRQWAINNHSSAPDVAATEDRWGTVLSFNNGALRLRNSGPQFIQTPNDVVSAGGSVLIAGAAGQIATSVDGRNFYFQPADGALETRDWNAVDTFDGAHAAVGGRGGSLVLTSAANTVPPEPPAAPEPTRPGGGGSGGSGGSGPGSGSGADSTAPLLDFSRFGAAANGGSVTVTVGCGASEAQGCRVQLGLTTRRRFRTSRRSRPRRVVVGNVTYTLRAGQRLRLRVPLSRTGRRLLRQHRRLSLRADLQIADVAGNTVRTSQTVTVRQPRAGRRR